MVKLCVGADDVDDLIAWQTHLMKTYPKPVHHTRMVPKRADDLMDGGSIYWVIKRAIRVRQEIHDVRVVEDGGGRPLCELVFSPELVLTELQPKKPFQGWRYLKPDDAPADLTGGPAADVPPDLGQALKQAMVW
ncbi:MAG: DUF1489 domain-containing protein [Pseudomonadota bacterium]